MTKISLKWQMRLNGGIVGVEELDGVQLFLF